MREATRGSRWKSSDLWETLEQMVRGRVQEFIHEILEDEVTEFLGGRAKSQRRATVEGGRRGYRTTFPVFEGCAPLTAAETGSPPGAEGAQADGRVPGEQDGASGSAGADPAGRHGSSAPGGGAHPVDSSAEVAAASAPVSEAGP